MTHPSDSKVIDYRSIELPEIIIIKRDMLMKAAEDAEAHMTLFAMNVETLRDK